MDCTIQPRTAIVDGVADARKKAAAKGRSINPAIDASEVP
jgi:hypothetical protein